MSDDIGGGTSSKRPVTPPKSVASGIVKSEASTSYTNSTLVSAKPVRGTSGITQAMSFKK